MVWDVGPLVAKDTSQTNVEQISGVQALSSHEQYSDNTERSAKVYCLSDLPSDEDPEQTTSETSADADEAGEPDVVPRGSSGVEEDEDTTDGGAECSRDDNMPPE